ncbi:MAG: hypothetical protein DRN30_01140 [Thermoplasmata archaeon]|nr:MAG: hypothetical protein DRN30_01140 [Thermoplasmata archaeon]
MAVLVWGNGHIENLNNARGIVIYKDYMVIAYDPGDISRIDFEKEYDTTLTDEEIKILRNQIALIMSNPQTVVDVHDLILVAKRRRSKNESE